MRGLELARQLVLSTTRVVIESAGEVGGDYAGLVAAAMDRERLQQQVLAHLDRDEASVARYVRRLGLGPLDYWLVMVCAAVERYPELSRALSILEQDERTRLLNAATFASIVQLALDEEFAHGLAAAAPSGRALRLGLVEAAAALGELPLTQQPLRLSAAELDVVLRADFEAVPERRGHRLHRQSAQLVYPEEMIERAARLFDEHGGLCLRARISRNAWQMALDIAAQRGQAALIAYPGEALAPLRLSAKLEDACPVLDLGRSDERAQGIGQLVEQARGELPAAIFLVPPQFERAHLPVLDVPPMERRERRRVWLDVVDEKCASALASRFAVTVPEARRVHRAACELALVRTGREHDEPSIDALSEQVLEQGARRMGASVTRIESNAKLERLVAPADVHAELQAIINWSKVSEVVFDEWQMGADSRLGRGLVCLFSGESGTGKTFAAQCIANHLGLNLYQIDLSQVVSKYIGETEKRLASIFDEAEAGHGVLLFDEADALFGKRSDVQDAHDRYANIEVGYLLQRIESFEGVSILTTNLNSNIDEAFRRRLQFEIDFPMPNSAMRRKLWEQSLPPKEHRAAALPLDDLVERFRISGGHIRNIGLAAAHLAAASPDAEMTLGHLVAAAYRELQKVGLPRAAEDFGPLAKYLEEAS